MGPQGLVNGGNILNQPREKIVLPRFPHLVFAQYRYLRQDPRKTLFPCDWGEPILDMPTPVAMVIVRTLVGALNEK
jgi:hypothetical protein